MRATHFCSCAWPWASQRPVRMMVSEDIPFESTPLSTVTSGAMPPGITVESHLDISAGSVLVSRLECWSRPTSSTAGSVATGFFLRADYDTVGSVMKADAIRLDKAASAGRPRDPRIDAAILAATADLLVEIGYSNLTMAAVAERAGTTKTALYRRWSSKAELVHEAAFPAAPTALAAPEGDIAADVRAMISAARDVFTSPVVRAALPGLVADMASDAQLNARVMARFVGMFDVVRVRLAHAVARGEVAADVDPDRLIELIGGATMLRMLLRPGDGLDDQWVEQTTAIVANGVLAPR